MHIGVIGGGVVGQATARTYLGFVEEVRVFDIIPERSTCTVHQALDCDLVFICLPEKNVESFMGLSFVPKDRHYVLKSTVPIGTTRDLCERYNLTNLVHSPEFLTERCAFTDALLPTRHIVGYPYKITESNVGCNSLLHRRFAGIPVHCMKSDESEAVKLFVNAFFATKISFFNEIHELCQRLNLDWDTALVGMLSDGRIAHSHTQVPGHDGQYGFGGKCLPKDLSNLLRTFYVSDLDPTLLHSVMRRNIEHDRTRRSDSPRPQ